MAFMTDRAGDFAQMGFVRISVFKFFPYRLLGQLVHRAMTGQATVVFHRVIGLGKGLAMTLGAGDPPLGMEAVHVGRTGPGAQDLLHQGHVLL